MQRPGKELVDEFMEILVEKSNCRIAALEDPQVFVREVMGCDLEWFHKDWISFQLANQHSLLLAPRGHGKSTICTVAYPLWRVLRDPELRILIVSNTQSQAQSFLREIRLHLESNPWVRENFGGLAGRPWSDGQINLAIRRGIGKEANVTAMGVLGPIISKHYDIIILDDVVDEENGASAKQRETLRAWYYKTLLPCLLPNGEIHIVGTRYHYLDLYGHLLGGEYSNQSRIYRAIDERDGQESALWESKYPLELLKEKKRDAGSAIFNSQYQNDVELMKGKIFRPEWIQYFNEPPARLEKIIGVDLAISRQSSADYFALVVAGRDKKSGKVYVLDAFRDRLTFSKQIGVALNYFEKHNSPESPVVRVCVESNAYQEAFAQKLRESGLPVKSVVRVKDKISRAYQLQARLENSEILFPRTGCEDLITELLLFPEADHDDLFDALEIAVAQFKILDYSQFLKPTANVEPEQ